MTSQNQSESDDNRQTGIPRRNKKRRIKKRPFIILGIILLLVALGIYINVSYKSGLKVSTDNGKKHQIHKFHSSTRNDGKVNVLVLGEDRKVDSSQPRTDSIMIVQYDYLKKDLKIVSVMRDIYSEIPGGYRNYKMNAAYSLGGPELLRKTLIKNLDIDPEYYAIIDFDGFEEMVDEIAPNGVPINVEKDMSEKIGVSLKKGQHNLNGKELLGYARFRHDAEGDFGRVRRQQQVMTGLKSELLSFNSIVKAPKLAGIARGYVNTNLDDQTIYKTGASFIARGDKNIQTLTVPVKGSYTNATDIESGDVLKIDKEKNKKAIKEFLDD
ncbi:LCP family protein [Mammaliicoccus sp. Dog046]|uniref:LCP family protein n=1 Tax=Mammaliicoccus sp. Dog046 TaxID=3034233 RepID=UPI002B26365E|nr:LCP family protein [Mammaliicoccus sp. Dog046]WQK84433.1 LCP family protein [Mammaliicoccus sp. Dog046]